MKVKKRLMIAVTVLFFLGLVLVANSVMAQEDDSDDDGTTEDDGGADAQTICLVILAVVILLFGLVALMKSYKIIRPYEQGLLEQLGSFKRRLDPGFNIIKPFVSTVHTLDIRTQTLDVPRQEVITKDNSPTNVDAVIYIKVNDVKKAFYEIENYKVGTIFLAQTTLRSVIGDMELDQVLSSRETINIKLRDILDQATDPWGVKVQAVEIREVDPARTVKKSMEEQTAAEREKRAAILRATGLKKSAILNAEGGRQAKILNAEGIRQSKILLAEGERTARILEAQGEAQKLRVLSLGAATLDQKSLSVLSLDALKSIGNGQATKIILPFEITKLVEGLAGYIGSGTKIPEHKLSDLDELEKRIGSVESVLGEVPTIDDIPITIEPMMEELSTELAPAKKLKRRNPLGK
jgi:regulator of protease activity HflC (stomatin/prohibitin superfamily)